MQSLNQEKNFVVQNELEAGDGEKLTLYSKIYGGVADKIQSLEGRGSTGAIRLHDWCAKKCV